MEKEGAVGKRFLVSSDTGFLQAGLCCVCVFNARTRHATQQSWVRYSIQVSHIYIYINVECGIKQLR